MAADGRRLAAIMFTDLVGYSALSHRREDLSLALLEDHQRRLRGLVAARGGIEIKALGDGFLFEFPSAVEALRCAFEIQQAMHERDATLSDGENLAVRIGIHVGDVVHRGNDVYGDAVNVAARLEPLAEPGGICLTGQVLDQVRNKFEFPIVPTGTRQLKNIAQPVETYRVQFPWEAKAESTAEPSARRIAVLPFANISPDQKEDYFADGLTDELITVLSRLPGTRVIARTSVVPYKSSSKPVSQIGAELRVSSVLEGSVRKAGEHVRITVQLIEVASQEHRWAETYDRKLEDVFAVQTEVAKKVAKALNVRLRGDEGSRLATVPSAQPESFLAYLRGRRAMQGSGSERALREAIAEFERAVALDPRNARAYAGLADATHLLALWYGGGSRAERVRAGREFATRAIRLDPDLAEAHGSLGLLLYDNNEWAAAEREAERALAINPSLSATRTWYALMLAEQGRGEDAIRELRLAKEADPQSSVIADHLSRLYVFLRRLDEAKVELDRLAELSREPSQPFQFRAVLAWYYYARSDFARAFEEAERAEADAAARGDPRAQYLRAQLYALAGDAERARARLGELPDQPERRGPDSDRALVYAFLGDLDECFRLLEEAYERAGLNVSYMRLDPDAEAIRRDPRFGRLLKKMRLA